jgi:subtilisin family serine protease
MVRCEVTLSASTGARGARALALSVSLAAALAACGGGGSGSSPNPAPQVPPPTFRVDAGVKPLLSAVTDPFGGGARALASIADARGNQSDFVANELIVSTEDTARLDALVARWRGTRVRTIDFAAAGLRDVPKLHLVRIDASTADVSRLADDLRALDAGSRGELRLSGDAALRLLAAGAGEGARQGMNVSLNWVMKSDAIVDRAANEAPGGDPGYVSNAFEWTYMNRGSAQDTGAAEAWRALAAAGRLSNRVKIMVMDGGFQRDHADFPAERRIVGGAWSTPNPSTCSGGAACPWHGTAVALAAMGRVDNAFGTAGPAGPVAELVAVQSPSPDFFAYLAYVVETLAALATERPRIVNISSSARIPAGAALFVDGILGAFTASLRLANILVFASAGNDGIDVDEEDCFLVCWEEALIFPCESAAVICVGGMGRNTAARADSSNFGSKTEETSVDIYGPFVVWDGPNPDAPDNVATQTQGTSFSSPFVAGVAALVMAADPALTAGDTWRLVRDNAHAGGVHARGGHQRRVNALAAVIAALGARVPPFIRIDTPLDGAALTWRAPLRFSATAFDVDSEAPAVTWTSSLAGDFPSSGPDVTIRFLGNRLVGAHVITATATSGGQTVSASINVTVRNLPPTVGIVGPRSGATFCTGEPVPMSALVVDPNNPPDQPFPASGVFWTYSGAAGGGIGNGFTVSRAFAAAGAYRLTATATDELGLPHAASVDITVNDCVNNPPTATIVIPVDVGGTGPDLVVDAVATDGRGWYADVPVRGAATDPEDGPLNGASLVWSTDRIDLHPGGALATSATPVLRLYTSCSGPYFGAADHVIGLRATDSGTPPPVQSRSAVPRVIRVRLLC